MKNIKHNTRLINFYSALILAHVVEDKYIKILWYTAALVFGIVMIKNQLWKK